MPRLNADIEIVPIGADTDLDTVTFSADEYDYLSFINGETYGIPPLITKTGSGADQRPPVAGEGERVLYVNPGAILTMLVSKRAS